MGKSVSPLRTSMVEIKIGNRIYPAHRSNHCSVCMHPARALIEERLLLNEPYSSITSWVSGLETRQDDGTPVTYAHITPQQLSNHFKRGHCPLDTKVLHEITEQLMADVSAPYEESIGRIVEPLVLAKLTMMRTQEMLARGELVPTVREGLAAAKLVHAIEIDAQPTEMERLQLYAEAVRVYFASVRKHVDKATWNAISDDLAGSQELAAIDAKLSEIDNIQDAELVEG
jgi:hypothetical protein